MTPPALLSWCGAAACLLLVTACGTAAAPGPGAGAATSPPASAASPAHVGAPTPGRPAKIALDVTIYSSVTAPPSHYVLRCEPPGGTVPDPAAACARLLAGPSLFGPRPAHVICPMILVAGARALVQGTYLGKRVAETIVDGGCDLQRWAQLRHVLS
ncbi:MAG TPA: SSI family serine proteinase inhibitor [Streptosporangiaceae bacterium]|nr:SSI family serine proteinase inhibitor [Streptosporangiaceae bacterium]